MKIALIAFTMFSTLALASGKFALGPVHSLKAHKTTPALGFSIYEPIIGGIAYNGWSGLGWQARVSDDSVMWVVSKHDFEKWFGNIGLSIGYTFQHADKADNSLFISDHNIHAKLTYKIW